MTGAFNLQPETRKTKKEEEGLKGIRGACSGMLLPKKGSREPFLAAIDAKLGA
jgi:hypothetical protein